MSALREVGFNTLGDLLGTYAGHAADLSAWLKDADINRDSKLRLQYLAGMQNTHYQADTIYRQILAQRRPIDPHIVASSELRQELRQRLGQAAAE
jgi:hypothetical protein